MVLLPKGQQLLIPLTRARLKELCPEQDHPSPKECLAMSEKCCTWAAWLGPTATVPAAAELARERAGGCRRNGLHSLTGTLLKESFTKHVKQAKCTQFPLKAATGQIYSYIHVWFKTFVLLFIFPSLGFGAHTFLIVFRGFSQVGIGGKSAPGSVYALNRGS